MLLLVQRSNQPALKLYTKMGYTQMERSKELGSQVCMRKHLFFAPPSLVPPLTFVHERRR